MYTRRQSKLWSTMKYMKNLNSYVNIPSKSIHASNWPNYWKKLFVLKPKYKILRIYMTGVIKLRQDDCETNSLLTDWVAALWWFVTNFVWSVVHNSWPECSIGWSVVLVSSSESCCWDVSAPPSSLLATSSGVPDTSALSSVLLES